MDLRPTGTCFNDAIDLLTQLLMEHGDEIRGSLYLVHGILNPPSGERYSHAWLEHQEYVVFVALVNEEPHIFRAIRTQYYEELGISDVTRYTPSEVARMNKKFGTYGPWEERYKILTTEGKRNGLIG